MNTVAPGQLAGYTLQYYRALIRLLQCKPGGSVSVEHIGDVSVNQENAKLILEEDKSSISRNPVSDLSKNLWKTFRNWILYLKEAEVDINKCRFVLYVVASEAKGSLLATFSNAQTTSAANLAIRKALKTVKESSSPEIIELARFSLEENRKMFRDLVLRLEVQSVKTEEAIEEEIRNILRTWVIPENRLDEIKNHCLAWLIGKILSDIRQGRTPIVEHNDFRKENEAFFKEFRSGILADYSKGLLPDDNALAAEGQSDKVYVRQLQAIAVSNSKILQACSDFYKAAINRHEWIERGLISPEAAEEFEGKLCSAFKNERERIELTNADADEVQKGKILLNACEGRQERMAGLDVADRTIPGTYHHLSDDLRVGWHPRWESLFHKEKAHK